MFFLCRVDPTKVGKVGKTLWKVVATFWKSIRVGGGGNELWERRWVDLANTFIPMKSDPTQPTRKFESFLKYQGHPIKYTDPAVTYTDPAPHEVNNGGWYY